MSHPMSQLGSRAINQHTGATDADEAEYDRLRGLAREEAQKRGRCFERSREAYSAGDGAAAHELSEEGKRHGAQMDDYNRQARDYIFRANNASLPEDTIDLHGLFVEEAEEVLEKRIKAAKGRGDAGLHVIVGKGNHSVNHVRKLEPAVEKICNGEGLKWKQEENEGRIYVWLKDGGGEIPQAPWAGNGGAPQQHHGGQHHGGQQHPHPHPQHPAPQQPEPKPQQPTEQPQQPEDPLAELKKTLVSKAAKKLGACCVIM